MTYSETLSWMFAQLPMFQRVGASAFRPKLDNTLALCSYLGNPQYQFRSIHIAGTNGKGSTSHMIASVLQEAGYRVGLYTSPHLKDFRERIRIDGEVISEAFVISFIERNKEFLESHGLSFFEMTVGMAFQAFAEAKVDYAVIETGMGGRLDSTNVITPVLSVITNIGMDHKEFLGDTLAKIAFEKAGIIKPGIPVVIGEYHPDTFPVFEEVAAVRNAPLYLAIDRELPPTDLQGLYQVKNRKTVLQALEVLGDSSVGKEAVKNGLAKVVANTGLRGRWDVLGHRPLIVADTAHNKEGLLEVMAQVDVQQYNHLHMVLGFVKDKDLEGVLPLFPKTASYYFCKPEVPRGLDASILREKAGLFGLYGKVYNSVTEALEAAKRGALATDMIYVGGSTFVVAEII